MSRGTRGRGWLTKPKPAFELRPWFTYRSVAEWHADYRGHVPLTAAEALEVWMREHPGTTFPDAYAALYPVESAAEPRPAQAPRAPLRRVRSPSRTETWREDTSAVVDRAGSPSPVGTRRWRSISWERLMTIGLVANRHPAVPAQVGGAWTCRTCGHGISLASRNGGEAFWRHNPKTFTRREVPRFPY